MGRPMDLCLMSYLMSKNTDDCFPGLEMFMSEPPVTRKRIIKRKKRETTISKSLLPAFEKTLVDQ
jgi:hypothetical protein